jgi:transcriptional regulator with XRE-family HTH domain
MDVATVEQIVEQTVRKLQKRRRTDQGSGSEQVGWLLKNAMEYTGFNAAKLAVCSGLHPTYIGKIINGTRGIGVESLAWISNCLPHFTEEYLKEVRHASLSRGGNQQPRLNPKEGE